MHQLTSSLQAAPSGTGWSAQQDCKLLCLVGPGRPPPAHSWPLQRLHRSTWGSSYICSRASDSQTPETAVQQLQCGSSTLQGAAPPYQSSRRAAALNAGAPELHQLQAAGHQPLETGRLRGLQESSSLDVFPTGAAAMPRTSFFKVACILWLPLPLYRAATRLPHHWQLSVADNAIQAA